MNADEAEFQKANAIRRAIYQQQGGGLPPGTTITNVETAPASGDQTVQNYREQQQAAAPTAPYTSQQVIAPVQEQPNVLVQADQYIGNALYSGIAHLTNTTPQQVKASMPMAADIVSRVFIPDVNPEGPAAFLAPAQRFEQQVFAGFLETPIQHPVETGIAIGAGFLTAGAADVIMGVPAVAAFAETPVIAGATVGNLATVGMGALYAGTTAMDVITSPNPGKALGEDLFYGAAFAGGAGLYRPGMAADAYKAVSNIELPGSPDFAFMGDRVKYGFQQAGIYSPEARMTPVYDQSGKIVSFGTMTPMDTAEAEIYTGPRRLMAGPATMEQGNPLVRVTNSYEFGTNEGPFPERFRNIVSVYERTGGEYAYRGATTSIGENIDFAHIYEMSGERVGKTTIFSKPTVNPAGLATGSPIISRPIVIEQEAEVANWRFVSSDWKTPKPSMRTTFDVTGRTPAASFDVTDMSGFKAPRPAEKVAATPAATPAAYRGGSGGQILENVIDTREMRYRGYTVGQMPSSEEEGISRSMVASYQGQEHAIGERVISGEYEDAIPVMRNRDIIDITQMPEESIKVGLIRFPVSGTSSSTRQVSYLTGFTATDTNITTKPIRTVEPTPVTPPFTPVIAYPPIPPVVPLNGGGMSFGSGAGGAKGFGVFSGKGWTHKLLSLKQFITGGRRSYPVQHTRIVSSFTESVNVPYMRRVRNAPSQTLGRQTPLNVQPNMNLLKPTRRRGRLL
jgi:hypothetical protein